MGFLLRSPVAACVTLGSGSMSWDPSPPPKLEWPAGVLEQRNQHRPGRQEGLVNAASGKAGEPHPGSFPEATLEPFLPAAQMLLRAQQGT